MQIKQLFTDFYSSTATQCSRKVSETRHRGRRLIPFVSFSKVPLSVQAFSIFRTKKSYLFQVCRAIYFSQNTYMHTFIRWTVKFFPGVYLTLNLIVKFMLNMCFEPVRNMFIFTLLKLNDLESLKSSAIDFNFVSWWFPRQQFLLRNISFPKKINTRILSVFCWVYRSTCVCLDEW